MPLCRTVDRTTIIITDLKLEDNLNNNKCNSYYF